MDSILSAYTWLDGGIALQLAALYLPARGPDSDGNSLDSERHERSNPTRCLALTATTCAADRGAARHVSGTRHGMKVLVFAHRLEVGGTQVNAIDLAAGLRDRHGFDVLLFATPGPMVQAAEAKGLRFIAAPDAYLHPSPARMRALRHLVRAEKPDLVHAWDWWQCIDAYYSVHLPMGIPMVVTDMMMDLTHLLPKQVWTTFGIPEVVDRARAAGWRKVELVSPPWTCRRTRRAWLIRARFVIDMSPATGNFCW